MNRKIPKPRNPYVQHLVTKKQGAHVNSAKAQRTRARASLRRETREGASAKLKVGNL
jgi:hypothetical protein